MAAPRQIYIAVIGVGGVGRCFMSQLATLSQRLSKSPSNPTNLLPILIARSSKVLFSNDYRPLSFDTWEDDLAKSTQKPLALDEIVQVLAKAPGKVVLIDNTSNQDVANAYPDFLRHGINVVTPNKKAFSGSYQLWKSIFAVSATGAAGGGHVFHESSVGAGLPVISTLKDLVETGDEVRRIEGVFSGTMSFLFNSFAPLGGGGGKFSAEVRKAKDLGYTEPDPRDDLNGLDVARKLTILARLAGLPISSPNSFPVQSLIPGPLESVSSGDEFLARLPEFDDQMEAVKAEAAAEGKVVRYVGSVDVASGNVKVGLEKFEPNDPIAALKGSDNIISFHTKRYGGDGSGSPLIIQGAGAGGEITAMGVTGDLIKVLNMI
ncbi:MAG: ATP-dependent DNA helicase II subunit 2 [Chaenotheca gracillima]|nr:MAG: ATP-dependent DNA helicase II subunit 2 [Chaenotheca gracillima]